MKRTKAMDELAVYLWENYIESEDVYQECKRLVLTITQD